MRLPFRQPVTRTHRPEPGAIAAHCDRKGASEPPCPIPVQAAGRTEPLTIPKQGAVFRSFYDTKWPAKGPKGLKRPCARDAQKNCFLLRNVRPEGRSRQQGHGAAACSGAVRSRNEQRQAYKHNTLLFNNKYTNSIRAHLHNTSFRTDTKPPAGHRIPCAPQLLLTAAATPSLSLIHI